MIVREWKRRLSVVALFYPMLGCSLHEEIPADISEPIPVHTVPVKGRTFVVFGDPQQFPVVDAFVRGGAPERAALRRRIRELNPDLILMAGDAVCVGAVEGFWKEFRREYAGMRMYPVIGNHELIGSDRYGLTYYFQTFPHVERRRWYEIRYGDVAFLMLDSNPGQMPATWWERQADWVRRRLAALEEDPSVRTVAVITHHPPISSQRGGYPKIREDLYALAEPFSKARLWFSGHHHAYQHIRDGSRRCFVTGGGGAPLFLLRWGKLSGGAELVKARRAHHLIVGRIGPDGVRIEMHALEKNGEWTVDDEVRIGA